MGKLNFPFCFAAAKACLSLGSSSPLFSRWRLQLARPQRRFFLRPLRTLTSTPSAFNLLGFQIRPRQFGLRPPTRRNANAGSLAAAPASRRRGAWHRATWCRWRHGHTRCGIPPVAASCQRNNHLGLHRREWPPGTRRARHSHARSGPYSNQKPAYLCAACRLWLDGLA